MIEHIGVRRGARCRRPADLHRTRAGIAWRDRCTAWRGRNLRGAGADAFDEIDRAGDDLRGQRPPCHGEYHRLIDRRRTIRRIAAARPRNVGVASSKDRGDGVAQRLADWIGREVGVGIPVPTVVIEQVLGEGQPLHARDVDALTAPHVDNDIAPERDIRLRVGIRYGRVQRKPIGVETDLAVLDQQIVDNQQRGDGRIAAEIGHCRIEVDGRGIGCVVVELDPNKSDAVAPVRTALIQYREIVVARLDQWTIANR